MCACALQDRLAPDFKTWWQEAKARGYTPSDFEREIQYFTVQALVSPLALLKAVQQATRRLQEENLAMLQRRLDLEWERSNIPR